MDFAKNEPPRRPVVFLQRFSRQRNTVLSFNLSMPPIRIGEPLFSICFEDEYPWSMSEMNMCGRILPCQNHTLFQTKKAKSITLFQTKTAPKPYPLGQAAHTHSFYIGVPPSPGTLTSHAQKHSKSTMGKKSPAISTHWVCSIQQTHTPTTII